MKLIDEAGKAWRMFSIWAMGLAGVIQVAWLSLPPDLIAQAPEWLRSGVTLALLGLGIVGRLVRQDKVSGHES